MTIETFVVDAFTDKAFGGNPAGVCLCKEDIGERLMQSIAAELRHSETAFIRQSDNDENHFHIRYFTPTTEIAFCGHATLASSKLILDKLEKKEISFQTHNGLSLKATKKGNDVMMLFPLYGIVDYPFNGALLKALGIEAPLRTGYAAELNMLMIHVSHPDQLQNLRPDYAAMIASSNEIKEVVVTAAGSAGYDFYSRCFCPWIGIDEDPVTGASHSVLAKYWSNLLKKKTMKAYQCSERGGYLHLNITATNQLQVTSNAVIVLEGKMHV